MEYGGNSNYDGFGEGTPGYNSNNYGGGGFIGGTPIGMGTRNSQSDTPSTDGNRDRQGFLPVTIRQLRNAIDNQVDDKIIIDAQEVKNVTIIGNVLKVTRQSTSSTLVLDDATGQIEVRLWIRDSDDEFESQLANSLSANMYVSAIGSVKKYHENVYLGAVTVRPIHDHNMITCHLLDAIHTHLFHTRGSKKPQQHVAMNTNQYGNVQQNRTGGYADQISHDKNGDFTELQNMIMTVMRGPVPDAGITVDDIYKRLHLQYPLNEISREVDFLSGEGHMYSTIDEQHFKITE